MNQKYIVFDNTGEILSVGFGVAPEGAILVATDEDLSDLFSLYVDGEAGLVPRPTVSTPTLDGDDLSLPSGPEGTVLRVVDKMSDEIMWETVTDETLTAHVLTLPDAGTYVVCIDPPFPYKPSQTEFVK